MPDRRCRIIKAIAQAGGMSPGSARSGDCRPALDLLIAARRPHQPAQPAPTGRRPFQAARERLIAGDSARNSRRSPGWHASAAQIASSVEKRIARALPVFRTERLASVMSMRSASSVSVMRRAYSKSSSFTMIAMSHSPLDVFAHQRALGEDTREDKGQEDGEPAADRNAGVEVKRVSRGRNSLANGADGEAQELEHEQCPGDGLEAFGIRGDEWIAAS